jgi:CubicO group peptidase (beta-lactamase class C family)
MKKHLILLLILSISQAFAGFDFNPLTTQITTSYNQRAKNGLLVGASIGIFVSQDPNTALKLNFGEAKSSHDFFAIGSISKTFTGILLSKLILEEKIALDAPIENLIPELKGSFMGKSTVHLLATHSAQLIGDAPGEFFFRESEMINLLKNYQPTSDFPAGIRQYSNLSFMTLSLIIRRVTGDTFVNNIKKHIFNPINMSESGFLNNKEVFSKLLTPHTVLQTITNHDLLLDIADATGGIFSNLEDMTKFLKANLYPKKFPTLTAAILFSQKLGLGWDSEPNASVLYKNGAMTGFGSMFQLNPSRSEGVIVLCNSRCTLPAMSLANIAMGGPDKFVGDLPIDDNMKTAALGIYTDSENKYKIEMISTDLGFLGLHVYIADSTGFNDSYLNLRLRQQSLNKFMIYDGYGAVVKDYVVFEIEPTTQKMLFHYFQMNMVNGKEEYEEIVFTKR